MAMGTQLKIQDVNIGYSQSGATDYANDIHQEAIVETKRLLGDVESIRTALEEGWQGQAELNFMTNLQGAVKEVQNALDELDEKLTTEFNEIESAWVEQDAEMVPVRYDG